MALGGGDNVFSAGELFTLPRYIAHDGQCTCGNMLSQCELWSEVLVDLEQTKAAILESGITQPKEDRKAKLLFLLRQFVGKADSTPPGWVQNNLEVYDRLFQHSGAEIIIDSSKNVARAAMLYPYLKKRYQISFLLLVRNCKGICASHKKNHVLVKRPNGGQVEKKSRKTFTPRKAGANWLKNNLRALIFFLGIPRRNYRLVRFEDFTGKPAEELPLIAQWLGIEYQDIGQLIQFKTHKVYHNIGGNASRFNASEIRPTEERWRSSLSPEEIWEIPMMARMLNYFLFEVV